MIRGVISPTKLWLRRTKRKKIPREGREGAWCPIAPNCHIPDDYTAVS